jgi:hypothetical protein
LAITPGGQPVWAQTADRSFGRARFIPQSNDEHEHAGARLTCHEQEIARFVAPNLAELVETLDLPAFCEPDRGVVLSWT